MTAYNSMRCLSSSAVFAAMLVAMAVTTSAQASVEISSKPTQKMSCSAGMCSFRASKAALNAADLVNTLVGGIATPPPDVAPLDWLA